MLNIVTRPEDLWRECAKLATSPRVIAAEIFNNPDDHFVLAYGPVAQRNQFQSLLYSAQDKFNVSILPINELELFGDIPWPGRVVCHFHWIHNRTATAKTQEEADSSVLYWEKILNQIKKNGHKIVWTVHNVMPHESFWVEQDKIIHQMMANAADALHVMASDSSKLTQNYYSLDDEKIFVVPHPTYEGAQPDDINRAEARSQLNISEDEFVFLSFGAIMEYKGYDRLMAAYDQVRGRVLKKIRLIIAGLPSDKSLVERIRCWGLGRNDVILDMNPVPNDKLQVYFRAADLAVCPYLRTMNSGAAMMATTFNIPVLGPRSGAFRDLERFGCGATFDGSKTFGLMEKMASLVADGTSRFDGLAQSKRMLEPLAVSTAFFNAVKRMVV